MTKPFAADLYCGLGGWTDGLIAEGWRVRGYDIEAHEYGDEKYPDEFVQRDILTMHGRDLADENGRFPRLIVSSSPCTEYSYMAMPWSRAKQIERALNGDGEFPENYKGSRTIAELNALFDAQFRIQREASEAAGRHIPMVAENVRGAQKWVGRAMWNYGSFYLWGDVPLFMPEPRRDAQKQNPDGTNHGTGSWLAIADSKNRGSGRKNPGFRFDGSGRSFQTESVIRHVEAAEGRKGAGAEWFDQNLCKLSSKSSARKAASAKIAKIPFALSSYVARYYFP